MLRNLLSILFLVISMQSAAQSDTTKAMVRQIDSICAKIDKENGIVMSSCDSVNENNGKYVPRCITFCFTDTNKKEINKIFILVNNDTAGSIYYNTDKIIKMELVEDSTSQKNIKKLYYVHNDNVIYTRFKQNEAYNDGVNLNWAYHFLSLGYKFAVNPLVHINFFTSTNKMLQKV